MSENKNTFEAPSIELSTVTLADTVTGSTFDWRTNKFTIPEIGEDT